MMLLASVVVSQSLEDSDQEKNVENLDDLIAQATFGDKIEDRVSHQVILLGLVIGSGNKNWLGYFILG